MSGFDLSNVFFFNVHCTCLLFTPLGPDHPWCASGDALTYHCACVSTWWNTILCQSMLRSCSSSSPQVNVEKYYVAAEAGITRVDLQQQLVMYGLTMHNLGSISSQALGGVISTATHGTRI